MKVSQILAKCPWEELYHLFSSFWGNLIWKLCPLVLVKIWGVFLNTLTADGKYPVEDWENLQLPMQMQLSEKCKIFSQFFFRFWNLRQILNILTQICWSWLMNFRNYRLWKTSSDHSVKSAISERALTVNIWKRPKCVQNLYKSTFIMCFHHFERSSFRKCRPDYSVKS